MLQPSAVVETNPGVAYKLLMSRPPCSHSTTSVDQLPQYLPSASLINIQTRCVSVAQCREWLVDQATSTWVS